jgi:hypothetical protein
MLVGLDQPSGSLIKVIFPLSASKVGQTKIDNVHFTFVKETATVGFFMLSIS